MRFSPFEKRLDTLLDMHFEKNGRPKGHLAPPEKSILKHRFNHNSSYFTGLSEI